MRKPFTLITGASSGIGMSFAEAYAQKGHPLILVARSKTVLEKLSKKIQQEHSIPVHVISQDLSLENSAEIVFEACKKLGVEIDLLINNAGFGLISTFEKQDLKRVQDMLILNILTLTKLSHLFLSQLKKHKGSILNVSSLAAFQPLPYWAVYAATKAYVLLFSEALQAEVEENGVHVMALCPGITSTQFLKVADPNLERTTSNSQTSEEVVREAINALESKKTFLIPGRRNYLTALLNRFVKRTFALKLAKRSMEKRYKKIA